MEYDNYDYNYQRYLDWRHEMEEMEEEEIEQEWQRRQCDEHVMDEWNEFTADIDRLKCHEEEEEEEKTTGEKIVDDAWKQEIEYDTKPCGCSHFDGACDHEPRPHGIDGTQCDCSGCTFDYGYCACGCAGDATKHAERERNKEFVHETVTADMTVGQVIETVETHGIGKLEEFIKDYISDKEKEEEEEPTSTESSFLRDERFWEDLKIATATGLIAVFFGMYLGRYTCS